MSVRRFLSRLPVAAQVIIALLVLGLGSQSVVFALSVWDGRQQAATEAENDLRSQLHVAQGVLEHLVQRLDEAEISLFLNSLTVQSAEDVALLLDANGYILVSSDPQYSGTARFPWLPSLNQTGGARTTILGTPDGGLVGMAPLCEIVPETLSKKACSWLIIRHGTAWRHQQVIASETKSNLALFGVNILFFLLCWWILNESVARPGQAIVAAIKRFRDGDQGSRCAIGGRDEVGQIAGAIDEAFETVVRQATRLNLLDQAIEQSPAAIIITDSQGTIQFVNRAFVVMSGHRFEDVLGRSIGLLQTDTWSDSEEARLWETLKAGHVWSGEFCNRRADGSLYWVRATISPVRGNNGSILHYLSIQEDITERLAIEAKLARKETHDDLTGLPNLSLALDRLRHATETSGVVAVIHLNIEGLTVINDTLGRPAGDAVIRQAGERLRLTFPAPDTVARVGGDEYLLILSGLDDPSEAELAAARALEIADRPFRSGGQDLRLTLRAGVAVFPRDGNDPLALARDAYSAAIRAKEAGGATYRLFNPALDEQVRRRFDLDNSLRQAVERGELRLFIQPFVSATDGRIVGGEALVRWFRPDGMVSPSDFIPLAEKNGAIGIISEWIVENAAVVSQTLSRQLGRPIPIAVNISPVEFHTTDLLSRLEAIKREWPDAVLEIEVTEGIFAGQDTTGSYLNAISGMGFTLAIDDFGTGYSSLSYLRDYPFTKLKIDRSFVDDIATQRRHSDIVAATVALAHKLNLVVTAEGVETAEQATILQSLDVDYFQGYHFHRPLPLDDFSALLR